MLLRIRKCTGLAAVAALIAVTSAGMMAVANPREGVAAAASGTAPLNCADGVTEVVDFSAFGLPIAQSCDLNVKPGVTTGLDVLESTGLIVSGTAAYGLAFICRIAGLPSNQTCASTPPARAYWEYWQAAPGQNTWEPSSLGAANSKPVLGGVDAWAFGADAKPADPPDAFRASSGPVPTTSSTTSPATAVVTTVATASGPASTTPVSSDPAIENDSGTVPESDTTVPPAHGLAVPASSAVTSGRVSGVGPGSTPITPSPTPVGTSSSGAAGPGGQSTGSGGDGPGVDQAARLGGSGGPSTPLAVPIVNASAFGLLRHRSSSSSPLPTVVVAAVVVAIAISSWVSRRTRRRRHAGD